MLSTTMRWAVKRTILFPYPTLFRSSSCTTCGSALDDDAVPIARPADAADPTDRATVDAAAIVAEHRAAAIPAAGPPPTRPEEDPSELQSRTDLVTRLLLEKR